MKVSFVNYFYTDNHIFVKLFTFLFIFAEPVSTVVFVSLMSKLTTSILAGFIKTQIKFVIRYGRFTGSNLTGFFINSD